jgi:inosine/xanthosine triphosphatase
MKTIALASDNPVKAQATRSGFNRMFSGESFKVVTLSVSSGVGDQPITSDETLQGAHNRARVARRLVPDADYWVGIEGGIEDCKGEMTAFAWVVVISGDLIGKGRTGTFYLPDEIARLIQGGKELGEADDIVFNQSNSKLKNGAIGNLTGNVIDRARLYEAAVVFALIPFKNRDLYAKKTPR